MAGMDLAVEKKETQFWLSKKLKGSQESAIYLAIQ